MTRLLGIILACGLVAGTAALAADVLPEAKACSAKAMDTNGDGMLSRDEFTKHHEAMWLRMKKTSSGMVDLKSMEAMKSGGCMMEGMAMHDAAATPAATTPKAMP
jgi:hypothetical protein